MELVLPNRCLNLRILSVISTGKDICKYINAIALDVSGTPHVSF